MIRTLLLARLPRLAALAPLVLSLAVAACGSGASADDTRPLELTLVHVNDHHSHLDAIADVEMKIGGIDTRVELGGFSQVAGAFRAYQGRDDVLKLHAGDASTGTLYYTLFKGQADAELMNAVCFDAFAVGNHEFDDGDAQLRRFIDHLHAGACQTPVLAANIRPQLGTPLVPQAADDYLKPYTVKTIKGVPVGIVGITIKGKTQYSSRPLPSTEFDHEAGAAQRSIDQLKARGVRHIVLLTHIGYEADRRLAAQLTDVDAIIGGDSHTLLGDFSTLGAGYAAAGPYPTQVLNKDGKPVCIGQAWEYGKAIGELRIRFNAEGEVAACAGQAALIVGDRFRRRNAQGAWAPVDAATGQQIKAAVAADPRLVMPTPDAAAAELLQRYAGQVDTLKRQAIGHVAEALCLVRTPGEPTNRSAGVAGCENANQLARGSDVAQIALQSFLDASLRADVAIQNAGGVRVPIKAGPISMGDAFAVLPFTNLLIELPLTGAQIADSLEEAVAYYLDAGHGSGGSHPYAAGLRWHLDLRQPRGQRFSRIEIKDRASGAWSAIDPARSYIVVTYDYTARGQDGYATFGTVYASGNYVNSYLLYTQAVVDHIRARGTVDRPAAGDYAHQSVITSDGRVLP